MRATLKRIIHNAGLLTFLAGFPVSCWAGYSYQLFDVPGSTQTQINAINDSGAFVGIYGTSSGYSGFFFSSGVVETLRAPGSYLSFPYGINERGDIVGQQLIDNPAGGNWWRPFVRYANGTYATFPELPVAGITVMTASAINNDGDIVGTFISSDDKDGAGDGYLFRDGSFTIFPNVWPEDIRDDGLIVATLPTYAGALLTNLSDLEEFWVQDQLTRITANALNRFGDVAGTIIDPNETGYVRHSDGTVEVISVPGQTRTIVDGMNNLGTVAGTYIDVQSSSLRTRGYIAFSDNPRYTVPEPATAALLALGVLALYVVRSDKLRLCAAWYSRIN